ncbi:MAG: MEDS domain-containing protein, partial [Proteobacteria bacterium]|nr:MEDS domain-containing protein [Pseudomonadota bacterium]
MEKELRKTGIDLIGNASWGTHLCQFYQTPEDLIDILVPYFKAGLENNEFCMWITAEPLNTKKAKASLKKVVRNLDDYIEKGQIEILDFSQWYTKSGKFDAKGVLDSWVEKEKQALERGFDGLRLTGNTFWLEDKDWRGFTEYKEMINDVIWNYKMLAICSYALVKCGATEIMDVIANHQFALVKRENRWEIIESSERKRAEETIKKEKWLSDSIIENTPAGIAFLDNDFILRKYNKACADLIRTYTPYTPEQALGMCYYDYAPGSRPQVEEWFKKVRDSGQVDTRYGFELVLKGEGRDLITYWDTSVAPMLNPDGKVEGILILTQDVTERKRTEDALRESEEKYRDLVENISDVIYSIDKNGVMTYISPAIESIFGYSPSEIIGKPLIEFVYKEDLTR